MIALLQAAVLPGQEEQGPGSELLAAIAAADVSTTASRDALAARVKAFVSERSEREPVAAAETLFAFGERLRDVNDRKSALAAYERAEQLFAAAERPSRRALAAARRGAMLHELRRSRPALAPLRIAVEGIDSDWERARASHYLGQALFQLHEYDEAGAALREAKRLYERLDKPTDVGALLIDLGLYYRAIGDPARALESYAKARKALPVEQHAHQVARTWMNEAVLHMNAHRDAACLTALEESEKIIDRGDVWMRGAINVNRGIVLARNNRPQEAFRAYDVAEAAFRDRSDSVNIAAVAVNRGWLHKERGAFALADAEFARAAEIYEKHDRHANLANVRANRAALLRDQGKFAEAVEQCRLAAPGFERLRRADLLASVRLVEAMCLHRIGDFAAAHGLFDELEERANAIDSDRERASVALDRADAWMNEGHYFAGLAELDRAERCFRAAGERGNALTALANRAMWIGICGSHEAALDLYDELEREYLDIDDVQGLAVLKLNRGRLLARSNDAAQVDRGYSELQEVEQHFKNSEQTFNAALAAGALGELLVNQRRWAEALKCLDRADAELDTSDDRLRTGGLWRGIALANLGRGDEAIAALDRHLNATAGLPGRVVNLSSRTRVLATLSRYEDALTTFARLREPLGTVLRENVQQLGARTSQAFRQQHSGTVDATLEALARVGDTAPHVAPLYEVFQLFHGLGMAQLLAEADWNAIAELLPDELSVRLTSLRQQLARERAEYARLSAAKQPRNLDARLARQRRLQQASESIDKLVAELEKAQDRARLVGGSRLAASLPTAATSAEVCAAMPPGTALIEFVTSNEHVAGFVLGPDSAQVEVAACDEAFWTDVSDATTRLARAVALDADDRQLLQRIAARVLHPLLAKLPEGTEALIIAPDGPLCALPFEALPLTDRPDSPFLVEKIEVGYVHSGTVYRQLRRLRERERAPGLDFVAFADPVCDEMPALAVADLRGDFGRLPEAAAEVRAIARLFADEDERKRLDEAAEGVIRGNEFLLHVGAAATESALKSSDVLPGARIVHLACHGRANLAAPSLSHLALGADPGRREDGLLFVRELGDLNLSADLLVLSACETASGAVAAFEGMDSLSRAGFAAGARSVIATRWRVPDTGARKLMERFYRTWITADVGKRRALAAAKRAMIAAGDPVRAWAGFALWSPD